MKEIMEALKNGAEIEGTFLLKYNDNDNVELSITIPITYEDEDGELIETTEAITQEIPASMLKMASMMGVF